jgi:hypothetical protein
MREALAALSEEDFASRQEYLEKVEVVKNYYDGLIKYYYEEMNKTLGYNSDIYAQDLEFRLGWSAETIGIS